MKGKEYNVRYFIDHWSLKLVRTFDKIEFGPKVGCIKLPNEFDTKLWKNALFIPNNKEFISSCMNENVSLFCLIVIS